MKGGSKNKRAGKNPAQSINYKFYKHDKNSIAE
jgi:hypothetical protein